MASFSVAALFCSIILLSTCRTCVAALPRPLRTEGRLPPSSLTASESAAKNCYNAIFQFGDSISDTGNLIRSVGGQVITVANLPYGETYFGHPTGRCSNGRLMIDFIAQALGFPLLPPYLLNPDDASLYWKGVNFAVAGATALNATYFKNRGINQLATNSSLDVQLDWFNKLLPSYCSSEAECRNFLGKSLFLVGEIGGNDYNYPFFQGKTMNEIKSFVPDVVNAIILATNTLIEKGAVNLVVPGNFPIGCSTAYLTAFKAMNMSSSSYDEIGCLKDLNEFAMYHNSRLQEGIHHLRKAHPQARISYGDYYGAAMGFFQDPSHFGFNTTLSACCGTGSPYNYTPDPTKVCGNPGIPACADPTKYVNWDGIHLTEKAYQWIASGLLTGLFTNPPMRVHRNC